MAKHICMIAMTKIIKQPGWPREGPPTVYRRLRLAPGSHASKLYRVLSDLHQQKGTFVFGDQAQEEISSFYQRVRVDRAIPASIKAVRKLQADHLQRALEILSSEKVVILASSIQEQARQLSKEVLVGEDGDRIDLSSVGAFRDDLSNVANHKELDRLLPYLTPAELLDHDLIFELIQDKKKGAAFIDSRKGCVPGPETLQKIAALTGQIRELRALFAGVDLWVIGAANFRKLASGLSTKAQKEKLWQAYRGIAGIKGFLEHDIKGAFASELFGRPYEYSIDGKEPELAYELHGYVDLPIHLEHLKMVLALTKYRLDGKLPAAEQVPAGKLLEVAALSAGYRLNLPVHQGESPKPGHINYLAESGLFVETVPALFGPALYQLPKNSGKVAVVARKTDTNIAMKAYRDRQFSQVVVFGVEDNAIGFELNGLLKAAVKLVRQKQGIASFLPGSEMSKIMLWLKLPHSIRTVTVGEVLDLAFELRLSGATTESFSSGLGLAEVLECCKLMGAKIMITITPDGGALVNFFIGPEQQVDQVIARELGY